MPVQVEALQAVVALQEEQLLELTARPSATSPQVEALLPRWRQEALRQYEQRLRAQLAAQDAVQAYEQQRKSGAEAAEGALMAQAVRRGLCHLLCSPLCHLLCSALCHLLCSTLLHTAEQPAAARTSVQRLQRAR